ncbi:MAG: hypothetical protein KC777_25395 [Cyanobacteria bacterium HKST-UBA02]|nr:hypothetical protein [Cyanobacteria bacterium HKST-UBA02]
MKSRKKAANKRNRNLKELGGARTANRNDLQKVEGGNSIGSIVNGGLVIGPAKPPAHSGVRMP